MLLFVDLLRDLRQRSSCKVFLLLGFLVLLLASHAEAQVTNDDCTSAQPIPFGFPIPFSTDTASASGVADPCNGENVIDLWYSFTAPCDGPMEISVCNADFDTVLAVWPFSLTSCPSLEFYNSSTL